MNPKFWQSLLLSYLALGVVFCDEPTAEQKALWLKIANTFKSCAHVWPLVNADLDGYSVEVTDKHKEACANILGEEHIKALSLESYENPKTHFKYEKDFVQMALLAKSKCQQITGGEALSLPFTFKKNIFKVNDDDACLNDIEGCTHGYMGYLMTQILKLRVRRLDGLDLKEYFCEKNIDLLDGLEKKGWLAPIGNNFVLNFCSLPSRRYLLEKLLVKVIEGRYSQKSTEDVYKMACTYILVNPELNKDHSETELPWRVVATKVIEGCKKEAAETKPDSEFPLKEEFIAKFKHFIEPYWKQVEDKLKAKN